jgi:predicted metalloprotease with PDZ domain
MVMPWIACQAQMLAGSAVPISYPGTIELDVDARDTRHRIMTVHETLPLPAVDGDFVLLFPKWIPGDHAPSGPIDRLAGLVLRVDAVRLDWQRDPADPFAFHVRLPPGARQLDVDLSFLAPIGDVRDGAVMTRDIIAVKWLYLLLYPAGYPVAGIRVHAQVRLPGDFRWTTSLTPDPGAAADRPTFAPVSLSTLSDSPLYAGAFVTQVDLDAVAGRVRLTLLADHPERATITNEQLAWHRALVREAVALFGYRPFPHYDFFVTLSAPFGINGLEHRESSEVFLDPDAFADWQSKWDSRYLVAHELVHAWNGKWRVPDGLDARDFNTDLRTDLLWVYEGQTQYWAKVLTARSGLWTAQQARDDLAVIAAHYSHYPAARWRALADSMHDPVVNARGSDEWRSWQRSEDYYDEGVLLWLDVDTLLRSHSHGKVTLDDAARAFFAGGADSAAMKPYGRSDVVDSLSRLDAFDWEEFFAERIDKIDRWDPLEGIRRGGYDLVFDDRPAPLCTAEYARRGLYCFSSSIGLTVAAEGTIESVDWEGPAFRAGLAPGMKLIAVDGQSFSPERLLASIIVASKSPRPIAITAQDLTQVEEFSLPYHDGPRYAHLVRNGQTPASLDAILRPRAPVRGGNGGDR